MYTIIMTSGKELIATVKQNIYQGDNNIDKIHFLLPQYYNAIDLSKCIISVNYIYPDSSGNVEKLTLSKDLYKGKLEYFLPIDSKFTKEVGLIEVFLTITTFGIVKNRAV